MSIFRSEREPGPYRLLLIAALALVVLVQVVAMAMVTRSQVQKAEAHYAAERTAPTVAAAPKTPSRGTMNAANVVNVGYVASRGARTIP